jgi:hypothetical protein
MSDRELLELAARAAGHEYDPTAPFEIKTDGEWREWNPLTNDGDALRLAVKLNLLVMQYPLDKAVRICDSGFEIADQCEAWNGDKFAATRRAIVRAAAAIGSERHE